MAYQLVAPTCPHWVISHIKRDWPNKSILNWLWGLGLLLGDQLSKGLPIQINSKYSLGAWLNCWWPRISPLGDQPYKGPALQINYELLLGIWLNCWWPDMSSCGTSCIRELPYKTSCAWIWGHGLPVGGPACSRWVVNCTVQAALAIHTTIKDQ